MNEERRFKVYIPEPHPKQAAFVQSPAKRKVIVAGRRGGKTTGAAILAAEAILSGRRVLEAAPTADQTGAFWEAVKRVFAAPIAAGIIRKTETERILEMPAIAGGGRIRCKTAWDADTLRGDFADLLILDEYSLMKPSAWDEVGAPMLLDNNGDAVFIFTPKRKNHAHSAFTRALGEGGRWAAWHFTSLDNPHLSKEALSEITADITREAYRQEIMAEFLDNEGAVFRNVGAVMVAPLDASPEHHAGHRLVAGIDWGKQNDYTAIAIGCQTCKVELARDRFNKVDYNFQRDRIKSLLSVWGNVSVTAETNSIGEPNIDALRRDGLNINGFETTATSKPPLIENFILAIERAEWKLQADTVWTAELEAYERKVSATTGRSSYSAPDGCHDDTVMARALMIRPSGGWFSGIGGVH